MAKKDKEERRRAAAGWAAFFYGLLLALALALAIIALILGAIAFSRNNNKGFEWNIPVYIVDPHNEFYAISSNYNIEPQPYPVPAQDLYFMLSKNSTFTNVRLRGNVSRYASLNTIVNITDDPIDIPLYFFKNSLYVATLLTVPANIADFDILVQGLTYHISTNDDFSFILDFTNSSDGSMGMFLFNVGFVEDT